ncbi:MAG: phage head morphogenesis protein [Shimia sp.]
MAKAAKVDVLSAIKEELQSALDEGRPYREFAKSLRPRLQKLGWWGEKVEIDPLTGGERTVRLGTPRRLRTIFRANVRSARAAGQWERIQRTKEAMPYLSYELGPSIRHRPTHEARQGMILPVDDPTWDTWFPPNGWNCKCWVRQITARTAEELGGPTEPIPHQTRPFLNERTGEIRQVPVGIDPGWQRNPGRERARQAGEFLAERMAAMDPEAAATLSKDLATSWRVRRLLGTADEVPSLAAASSVEAVPIAVLPPDARARLGGHSTAWFSDVSAAKQIERHGDVAAEDYARIGELVLTGRAGTPDGGRTVVFHDRGDRPWVVVLREAAARDRVHLVSFYQVASRRFVERKLGSLEVFRE